MSYASGELPGYWKEATIVPVPKPHDPASPRPISLTSCFSKMLEKIVLNRLLYRIEDQLHDSLNGFIKGSSTSSCIATYLANTKAKYTVFRDLISALTKLVEM